MKQASMDPTEVDATIQQIMREDLSKIRSIME